LLPEIALHASAGAWPPEPTLRGLSERAVAAAISAGGLSFDAGTELSIVFADDAALRSLNHKWRAVDKPTNVLSFPAGKIVQGAVRGPLLGDIVLAFETIHAEAGLEGKRFEHHLQHLMVHGFLHLFGYDHQSEEDAEVMEEIERRALVRLSIDDPYA
jgi:probable rRNA maturation factor